MRVRSVPGYQWYNVPHQLWLGQRLHDRFKDTSRSNTHGGDMQNPTNICIWLCKGYGMAVAFALRLVMLYDRSGDSPSCARAYRWCLNQLRMATSHEKGWPSSCKPSTWSGAEQSAKAVYLHHMLHYSSTSDMEAAACLFGLPRDATCLAWWCD